MFLQLLLLFINFISKTPIIIPNAGSIYQHNLNIPIIGEQIIKAEIVTNNYAYITLGGFINERGTVKYINKNNENTLKFSYNIRKIIKKYKTEFSFPYYDIKNDKILFNLHIKIINYNKSIIMKKIN